MEGVLHKSERVLNAPGLHAYKQLQWETVLRIFYHNEGRMQDCKKNEQEPDKLTSNIHNIKQKSKAHIRKKAVGENTMCSFVQKNTERITERYKASCRRGLVARWRDGAMGRCFSKDAT